MSKRIIGLLLLSFLNASPKWNEITGYTFDQFVKDFGKEYATPEDRAAHEAAFNDRLKEFIVHNQSASTYKKGVSRRTDRIV